MNIPSPKDYKKIRAEQIYNKWKAKYPNGQFSLQIMKREGWERTSLFRRVEYPPKHNFTLNVVYSPRNNYSFAPFIAGPYVVYDAINNKITTSQLKGNMYVQLDKTYHYNSLEKLIANAKKKGFPEVCINEFLKLMVSSKA